MELFDALHGRRSIRRYTKDAIPEELVEKLLRAAMAAPSANNLQPWRFVVLDDRALLDVIPEFHPHAGMCKSAPLAIVVLADRNAEPIEGYWVEDCAAATQNLLLAAHGLGLGAVWLGVYPRPERAEGVRVLLRLPAHIAPFAIIALGHPAETRPPEDRFDPSRVHRNRWQHKS